MKSVVEALRFSQTVKMNADVGETALKGLYFKQQRLLEVEEIARGLSCRAVSKCIDPDVGRV